MKQADGVQRWVKRKHNIHKSSMSKKVSYNLGTSIFIYFRMNEV